MSRLIRPFRRGVPILQPTSYAMITTTTPSISSTVRLYSSFLQTGPAPPRLPPDQQAEFERLQRAAEAALSSHTTIPAAPEQQQQQPLSTSRHVSTPSPQPAAAATATATATSQPETLDAGSFSGGIRKGAPPEFEGDTNPVTGEVGGPKNEPLRWGSAGDWSFNGRVTDF